MKKMVVLTEGQTEQIFIAELLLHIAVTVSLKIDKKRLWGGGTREALELEISSVSNSNSSPDFYVLIIDCASDGRVISTLRERYEAFVAQNYESIIIVRDVRPDFDYEEVDKARDGFSRQLPTSPVLPVLVLATMEIETWFLRELSHFSRLDATLDENRLRFFGLEEEMNFEKIQRPAKKLSEIYETVNLSYGKSKMDVERTVNALNKDSYSTKMIDGIPSIKPLVEAAYAFLDRSKTPSSA